MANYTTEQYAIIKAPCQNILVSAVPGSGKSQTLIGRIIYLLRQQVDLCSILVVMFNRDAADGFTQRLRNKGINVSDKYRPNHVRVCTFHSFALEELKRADVGLKLAYRHRQQHQLLFDAFKKARPPKGSSFAMLEEKMVLFKAQGTKPSSISSEVFNSADGFYHRVYYYYEKARMALKLSSVDDWIADLALLLQQNQINLIPYAQVIVDEYQDINLTQQMLLKNLAQQGSIITAVGDEDQCIYQFRGARPDFMDRKLFERELGRCLYLHLSHTFRFGHELALCANALIRHNKNRVQKLCISNTVAQSTEVTLYKDDNSYIKAVELMLQARKDGLDTAVLTRTNAQLSVVGLLLCVFDIPIKNQIKSSDTSEKALQPVALLINLALSDDHQSTIRANPSLFSALLAWFDIKINGNCTAKACVEIFNRLITDKHNKDPLNVCLTQATGLTTEKGNGVLLIIKIVVWLRTSPLFDALKLIEKNHCNRLFDALVLLVKEANIALPTLLTAISKNPLMDKTNGVWLSTCHSAKGLEFDVVIMPDLNDQEFPTGNQPCDATGDEIEEERRLFYVGMTRAKKRLCLICPIDQQLDNWEQQINWYTAPTKGHLNASRFVYESDALRLNALGAGLYKEVGLEAIPAKDFLSRRYFEGIS